MARAQRLFSILLNHYRLIAERLAPHLGDIRTHPGFRRLWDRDVDECFLLNDVWAAEAILRRSAIPWHLVRWQDSANLIERNDDYAVCLDQTDAVTYVLSACRNSRCSPDAAQVNDDGSMDFGLGGLPFARIEPLRTAPRPDSGVLGRAEQTLLGHVPGWHGIQALHRQMTQWPGLSGLALSADVAQHFPDPASDYGTHLPHPLEWRNGAQRMLKKCGETDPPAVRIELIAAAALGAPGWDHLISAWRGADPTAMMPWGIFDVASEDEPYELISVHADAIRAFPAYVRAAASALSAWGAAELAVEATRRGPRFKVSRPVERVGDRFAITQLQLRQPAVVLAALRVEEIDDEGLRAEVGDAMAKGPAALQRIFGIGQTPLHKQLAIDRWSELALFLEESPWRFSLCETGDPMGSLAIEYLNKMGNRIGPLVYIARHRGCIAWVARERAYVAFDEYRAHKPCALLRGLSKTAAAELQACFEDPAPDKIYLNDDDRQRLDRMRALPIPMWPH